MAAPTVERNVRKAGEHSSPLRNPPSRHTPCQLLQKHSRIAFLGASALLLVSSSQHLTVSATGGVSVLRPFKRS